MANPQTEDGHIDIANELGEALARTYLNPSESKVLWAIFRKTYGWHKKTDRISYSQFEELTKLNRWHITPIIKRLLTRQIITRSGNGYDLEYGIQKDYEKWKSLPEHVMNKSLPVLEDIITQTGNESLPKQVINVLEKSLPVLEKSLPEQVIPFSPLVPPISPTKASTKSSESLPDWIDEKTWNDFLEVRKKLKAPPTDRAIELLIKDLVNLRVGGDDPNEILEQSIKRGWKGLFPLKDARQNRQKAGDKEWNPRG